MQRVKTPTAVAEKPAYATDGTPGYFRHGDPVQSVPATVPGQDWFNQVQEELVNVILEAGIELDPADDSQVAQAVLELIGLHNASAEAHADIRAFIAAIVQATETAAGLIELATSAEVAALTDPQRAVTPAGLGAVFGKSLAANGYQRLPGGLILQWGAGNCNSSGIATVTFPLAFPNACLARFACDVMANTAPGSPADPASIQILHVNNNATTTQMGVWAYNPATVVANGTNFYWFAVGH